MVVKNLGVDLFVTAAAAPAVRLRLQESGLARCAVLDAFSSLHRLGVRTVTTLTVTLEARPPPLLFIRDDMKMS